MYFDMQKYIYSERLFNTLYIEINTNAKKITFGQNKPHKNAHFFSLEI